ncbi:hypothetical protein Dimus_038903 [Dionaea muscipula]
MQVERIKEVMQQIQHSKRVYGPQTSFARDDDLNTFSSEIMQERTSKFNQTNTQTLHLNRSTLATDDDRGIFQREIVQKKMSQVDQNNVKSSQMNKPKYVKPQAGKRL